MITRPMLAVKCTDKSKLWYPVLATPKLDGIRCLIINGQALSRNFKPIPNEFVRKTIENICPNNVDGEIVIPGKPFCDVTSAIMSSVNAEDVDFQYWIFDYVKGGNIDTPYVERMLNLQELPIDTESGIVVKLFPKTISNEKELDSYEEKCLTEGYEGVIVRSVEGPYKCGRSTEKEGYLLKIKRFEDSEAIIIGFEEKMHNNNVIESDAFGNTKRSSCKANLIPAGTLGNVGVRDLTTNQEFNIGTGFDDELRKKIWKNQSFYSGKVVKYKFQPSGAKELPRFPVFLGFRDKRDM